MQEQYLNLPVADDDVAFGLMATYETDPHQNKVSLLAGAYRDENGLPWVLPSVQEAKARLSQQDHEYLGIAGSTGFVAQAQLLTFGTELCLKFDKNIASMQTVSGTGANHIIASFLVRHLRPAHVFIPSPTWINHRSIWAQTNVSRVDYPYYEPITKRLNLVGMLAVLEAQAKPNDVLVLQACAHNPTGVDLSTEQWLTVMEVVKKKGMTVVFDSAYQGFATGDPENDAWAIRHFANEMLRDQKFASSGLYVAQSFSKNFGLYGERVGAVHLVVPAHLSTQGALSEWKLLARAEYSNPPRYGASVVETVLADDKLKSQWKTDLVTMSSRIKKMRAIFRKKLEGHSGLGDWSHIEDQIGMFSYTGLDETTVHRLREEFHVYLLPSGRASICGLNEANVDYVVYAIGQVLNSPIVIVQRAENQ